MVAFKMSSWFTFASLGLLLANSLLVNASPLQKRNGTCANLNKRKSWNVLTDGEKSEFLRAQKCLMNKEPKVGTIWNANNRWDEFDFVHCHLANFIHDSGQFLPWHRWFVRVLELALQEECNYNGSFPYWDELKDQATAPLNESAVFDIDLGFGGNGDEDNNWCITDGRFANTTLVMNQTGNFDNYCISRELNQTRFDEGPSQWRGCMDLGNYSTYWPCNSNTIHGIGHQSVGGIMNNAVTATGDPLFFLHHAWLDRAWWKWQLQDKENRLYEMGGSNLERDWMMWYLGVSPPNKFLLDYDGDDGNITTLNHVLYTYDLRANVTINDVMDLNGDTICAEYIDDGDFNYTRGY